MQMPICMQSIADVDRGLTEVMALLADIKISRASYREVKNVDMLDSPLTTTGVLTYSSPDTLVRDVQEPQAARYEIRGGQVTIIRGKKIETIALGANPLALAFIESFRSTLAGNLEQLQVYYVVEFSGSVKAWKLQLLPRDKQMRRIIENIVIEGNEAIITVIETYEANGDWTRMELMPIDMQGKSN